MIQQIRQIANTASKTTKRMRSNAERRALAHQPARAMGQPGAETPLSGNESSQAVAIRFDQMNSGDDDRRGSPWPVPPAPNYSAGYPAAGGQVDRSCWEGET